MDAILDISDLCRLCLEASPVLIPLAARGLFGLKSICDVIKYCLDIDCNVNDQGILPKHFCQSCYEKLVLCLDFKNKSKESEKYLSEILQNSTDAPPHPAMPIEEPEPEPEEQLLTPYSPQVAPPPIEDDDENDEDIDPTIPYYKQRKSGDYHCQHCTKTFKYIKPYKNHLKSHRNKINMYQSNGLTPPEAPKGRGRPRKQQFNVPPQQFPVNPPPPVKSKHLSNLIQADLSVQTNKRPRPKSPSPPCFAIEQNDEMSEYGEQGEQVEQDDGLDLSSVLLEGFSEVDVNSVLKSSTFSFAADDSASQSALSTNRSRSRSSSVEVIPEFDIFGAAPAAAANASSATNKLKPSSTGWMCGINRCTLKFQLKVNLRKHQRDVHNFRK